VHRRIVLGLAATFSGLTVLLVVVALAARQPLVLVVAIPFGVVAYVTYLQATGRLLEWTGPGPFGRRSRQRARRVRTDRGRGVAEDRAGPWTGDSRWAGGEGVVDDMDRSSPSDREAYRVLGLDPGANQRAIRDAYRRKVKDVHPDADGGDEEEFKRVAAAYETLRQ
jgi:hypothetical protein